MLVYVVVNQCGAHDDDFYRFENVVKGASPEEVKKRVVGTGFAYTEANLTTCRPATLDDVERLLVDDESGIILETKLRKATPAEIQQRTAYFAS